MTVQTQSRLEPQRVPCRQPSQLDLLLVEQNVGEIFGLRIRDRDLEAVFARVAAAGDVNRGGGGEGVDREMEGLAEGKEFLDGNVLGQQALQGDVRLRTCRQVAGTKKRSVDVLTERTRSEPQLAAHLARRPARQSRES